MNACDHRGLRRHTLLPLNDCPYALQPSISHLTRSSLHRCLLRHGISRLPQIEGDKRTRKAFKRYPIGYFHIDIAEVRLAQRAGRALPRNGRGWLSHHFVRPSCRGFGDPFHHPELSGLRLNV